MNTDETIVRECQRIATRLKINEIAFAAGVIAILSAALVLYSVFIIGTVELFDGTGAFENQQFRLLLTWALEVPVYGLLAIAGSTAVYVVGDHELWIGREIVWAVGVMSVLRIIWLAAFGTAGGFIP